MSTTITTIILATLPFLLILAWLLDGLITEPRRMKKAEQESYNEFERDWNTYMQRSNNND